MNCNGIRMTANIFPTVKIKVMFPVCIMTGRLKWMYKFLCQPIWPHTADVQKRKIVQVKGDVILAGGMHTMEWWTTGSRGKHV